MKTPIKQCVKELSYVLLTPEKVREILTKYLPTGEHLTLATILQQGHSQTSLWTKVEKTIVLEAPLHSPPEDLASYQPSINPTESPDATHCSICGGIILPKTGAKTHELCDKMMAARESNRIDIPTMAGLLSYLNYQYPPTKGNIPLEMLCGEISQLERENNALVKEVEELNKARNSPGQFERHLIDERDQLRAQLTEAVKDGEQARLDAAKWAMTEAAEIVIKKGYLKDSDTKLAHRINLSQLVLTRRDNLTVEDMK